MRMTTDWSTFNSGNSWREQKRRESNGKPHRETNQINSEIHRDKLNQLFTTRNERPRLASVDNGPSIDKQRANRIVRDTQKRQIYDDIRARFGPRLVKSDGTARYTFQCKK